MTSVQFFIQQAINAISIGSLYALMAIGLAMVFGILRLINFAHGDLIMVGSYAALLLLWAGLPFWLAALAGIAASTIAGLIMERIAYRPIRGAPDVAMLLTSFAVTILLENAAILIFNPTAKPFPAPAILKNALQFGPLRIASLDIVAIVVAITLLVLLTLFVTRTEVGISMRAASEDLLAARLVGINVNAVLMHSPSAPCWPAWSACCGAFASARSTRSWGFIPCSKRSWPRLSVGWAACPGRCWGAIFWASWKSCCKGCSRHR